MKKSLFLLAIVMFVAMQACDFKSSKPEVSEYEFVSEVSDAPDYAKFGFKSGVVEMDAVTMGIKQHIVMYFDDWGRKVVSEIHMNFMGQKTHVVSYVKDGWAFEVDMIQKTGTKRQLDTLAYDQINYMKMTDEVMAQYNITYIGDVELLGRQCKEYEIFLEKENMKAKTAVWNGIAIRSEATMMGITAKINVTSIQENVVIPDEKFQIPEDIKFVDADDVAEKPQ
jgi:hypothetical protein